MNSYILLGSDEFLIFGKRELFPWNFMLWFLDIVYRFREII